MRTHHLRSHPFQTRIGIRRGLAVSLLLLALSAHADSDPFEVNLAPCVEKDCQSNQPIHKFEPEGDIEVQAGYNIVHWEGERGTKLYPLFQVFNRTGAPIDIRIGLQLLNEARAPLLEVVGSRSLEHTTKRKPSYETGISVNAGAITREQMNNAKYMRVVFSKESP